MKYIYIYIYIYIYRLTAFKKRLLRDTNGSERGKVTGGRRALHSEGLQNLCSLPDITRIIESRRTVSWQELVAQMEKRAVRISF